MQTKAELFQEAINKNDISAIKSLLPDIENINVRDQQFGNTALISAIWNNDQELIQSLLEKKIDVNTQNRYDETALMFASLYNQVSVVNILLATGAHTEIKGMEGRPAIWYAASENHFDILKLLLAAGANPNPIDNGGFSLIKALEESNIQGNYNNVLFILKYFGTLQYRLKEIEFNEQNLNAEDMEIYASCRDPITLEIINDPIAVSSGITYERKSLRDWFESKKDPNTQAIPETLPCPITKLTIQRGELNNNTHVITKAMINRFVLKQETEFKQRLHANASALSARASDDGLFAASRQVTSSSSASSLASDSSNSNSSINSGSKK